MNSAMLSLAASLTATGEPFAVATVVRREAPSSARLGDTAIVTRDGRLHGFIGGSCTRATVVHQALQALASAEARLISFHDDDRSRADDIVSVPMTCHSGGSVEIYIDPVFPVPRLLLLGSSPVNHALARLGKAMGYSVHAGGIDDPDGVPDGVEEVLDTLDGLGAYADRDPGVKLFVLVATMGESDEDMLSAALPARPDYVGVIASRRRMEQVTATLRGRGESEEAVAAVDGPAGLDLGATRPEEIAVSVLAKIVATQHDAQRQNATESAAHAPARDTPRSATGTSPRGTTSAPQTPGAGPVADATKGSATRSRASVAMTVDPVCNMTVPADGSKPHAEHRGVTYYFCCSGCRDHFVADPDQFVEANVGASADEEERA